MSEKEKQQSTISRLVSSDSGSKTNKEYVGSKRDDVKLRSVAPGAKEKVQVRLLERLQGKNMLVSGSDMSREMIDDYRRVKRPLVSNAVGKNKLLVEHGNIILVTSSLPNEGKSYTSVNLALSIAQELDSTALLIDCDVAKRGVSKILGIEDTRGLVDVLESSDVDLGDVMQQTDIPSLNVVSAGKHHEFVTELLASDRMENLVNEIATRYSDRIVILDGPPMLPTPQTQVLAGLVGQVVFVIEAGKTPQALVQEALEMIPQEQAVGLVLNKNIGLSGHGGYYYGYYGTTD